MGCILHPRGRVWRGDGDRIRATCCLIYSLLISSLIFYMYVIFSLIMLFLKNVCNVMCREIKGVSSDIFFIEKASIKGLKPVIKVVCLWGGDGYSPPLLPQNRLGTSFRWQKCGNFVGRK